MRHAAVRLAAALAAVSALAACGSRSDAAPGTVASGSARAGAPGGATTTAPEPGAGPCAAAPFRGSRELTVSSGGAERHYRLHLPAGARAGHAIPLLLALHGQMEDGAHFERRTGLSRVADADGFAVAYPSALRTPARWTLLGQSGPDDVAFAAAMVSRIEATTCIDTDRVSAFGHSNGGGFAVELACDPRLRLAGVVSASGGYRKQTRCSASPPPLLALHGDADPIVPYSVARAFYARWRRWAGCDPRPAVSHRPDGTVRERWRGCRTAFVHLRRPHAGHELPASGPATAWRFLAPLRSHR